MAPPKDLFQPYASFHENVTGAGDQRPTALQVLEKEGFLNGKLKGKTFLITGCSAGLGVETARALHATGADIYMTVRESKKSQGEKIIQDIKATSPGNGKLELVLLDLSSFASIRAGAKDFIQRSPSLNVLICNAGVMMCPESATAEGFEMQMGTNALGHHLLFDLLKDLLLQSATAESSSRVVVVSSAGHMFSPVHFDDLDLKKQGYNGMIGYGQSKTANIYMAASIERHYGGQNLHATSVHPGVILETDLPRHQTADSMDADFDLAGLLRLAKSTAQGCATQVWAATTEAFNSRGGTYLADLGECGPFPEGASPAAAGYGPHIYDEAAEERFWELSCKLIAER